MSYCVSYLTLLIANIKNRKKIATDSNYLRCHALLTALHFPLETTWSCKQDRKERYWGQQFWQMERDISVRPTEMTRPARSQSTTFKASPEYSGRTKTKCPFYLMHQPKLPEFWVEWKAPHEWNNMRTLRSDLGTEISRKISGH